MKILHAIHHYWPCVGGMENALTVLCEEQARQGANCNVVCLDKCARSDKCLKEREKRKGVKIERKRFLDLGLYKIAFGALGHAEGCKAVHVHGLGFFADLFLLFKFLHKRPVVIGSYGGVFHTGSNPLKWFYFSVWNRLLLRNADKVVVISGHDLELYRKIVPEEKIEFIPVPVDFKRFKAGKKEKNSFVFVGRLSSNKRVDLLIDAFAAASKGKKAVLHIVGGDFEGLEAGLEARARESGAAGKIKFHGRLSDKETAGLISKSDFFISASDYESFGVSAIEAMASGCIPVLSNIASFESFLQKEKNGFILDFHNTKKAAAGIRGIMELGKADKERKRKNAFGYVKVFEPGRIAKKLGGLYSGL